MRRIFAICAIAVCAAIVVSAPAAAGWTLTETKVERILMRDATVRLSPADKASLEEELQREVRRFRGLELAAMDVGDTEAWWIYNAVANRYFMALESVRSGLGLEDAACTGAGRAVGGNRFQRFNCLATSEVLSIPSTELDTSVDGGLPAVVTGEPREVGPLMTQFRVRVTGKSAIQYR